MIFTSALQGSSTGLGDTQLTPDQRALLTAGLSLSEQETALRAMFGKLAADVATLAKVGKAPSGGLLNMLYKYNAAVAAHYRAVQPWLAARATVPKSKLPDPDAQPVAVPTFVNLPVPSGLGNNVSTPPIAVKYGIVGQERIVPISDFVRNPVTGFAGPPSIAGLGFLPAVTTVAEATRITITLLLMFAGGYVVIEMFDTFSGNRARQQELASINKQSDNQTKIVTKDFDLYQAALRACAGRDPDQLDFDQRLMCIDKANEALTLGKSGRQSPVVPISLSPIITFAAIAGLGILSWTVYTSIKRKRLAAEHGGRFAPPPRPPMPRPGPGFGPGVGPGAGGFRAQPRYPTAT